MMHEHGKSDRRVVPTKSPNKGAGEPPQGQARPTPAEAVEGRRLAKSNPHQRTMLRTQRRVAHVTRAGADTSSSKSRSEDAVHRAFSPCLSP